MKVTVYTDGRVVATVSGAFSLSSNRVSPEGVLGGTANFHRKRYEPA